MDKLSFVIPVYNEEDNLLILYQKIMETVPDINMDYEILFVDDGSIDKSLEILKEIKGKDSNVKVVVFQENRGQSAAIAAGFKHASGTLVVTLDADLQNDPSDIPEMLKYIPQYDVVCGYRAKRQDNLVRILTSKISNYVRNKVTKDNIIDTGCSLKIYKKEYLDKIKLFKGMHRFLPTLLRLEGAAIHQVKVKHHPRKYGLSKYGIKNRIGAVIDLLAVRWMINRHISYKIKEII